MDNFDFLESIKINSCGISNCGADWRWDTGEDGFHDFDFWFVVRGRGHIMTDEENTEAARGACFILFPDTHYIGEHDTRNPIMTMNVHFSVKGGKNVPFHDKSAPFILRKISDISYMSEVLHRVIRLYNADKKTLAETVFKAVLVEYFTQKTPENEQKYGADKPVLVQKMCDAINIAPASAPNLSQFAAEYGYSADYLGRVFSSGVGISFSEYVANARVNKAKFLLSSTAMPLEYIAESLGYYDTCHFARQFKRVTGTSPGKYRKGR